jgi:hypothetical protein
VTDPKNTYYLTKYALTEGIKEVTARNYGDDGTYVYPEGYTSWFSFKLGRDVFESRADAVKAAEAMRIKKIASLRKQIAKLEKLSFGEGA